VLTAKHCVAGIDRFGSAECDQNGNLFFPDASFADASDTDAADADALDIDAGMFGLTDIPDSLAIGPSGFNPYAPHVARILVLPGSNSCKDDMAFLLLDRSVDDPTIMPVRLERAPSVGERLTAIGWGETLDASMPSSLQRRDVMVLAVGPVAGVAEDGAVISDPLPVNYFAVGESTCYGDSGSPALSAMGAVVGVLSMGDNPTLPILYGKVTDCLGPATRGYYLATAAEQDFIRSGYAMANATPWLEGEPDPRANLKDFGANCSQDSECKSNVCVAGGAGRQCSVGCLDTVCPYNYECRVADAHLRCVPDDSHPAGGCTVLPRSSGSLAPSVLLATTIAIRRRRRRR
jgi:hypothetical protein